MAFFKLTTKKKWVLVTVCLFVTMLTTVSAYQKSLRIFFLRSFQSSVQRYDLGIYERHFQLVDVILVKAVVDPKVKLTPEQQISDAELETVLINAFKDKMLEEFPDIKVTVEPYGRRHTLETNPFGSVWQFCLVQHSNDPRLFSIYVDYYRKDSWIEYLSSITYVAKGKTDKAKEAMNNLQMIKYMEVNYPRKVNYPGTLCRDGGATLGRPFEGKDKFELTKNVHGQIAVQGALEHMMKTRINLSNEQYDFAKQNAPVLKEKFYKPFIKE